MKTGKILVVEDDREMREELAELLSLEERDVVTTRLGLEGKRLLESDDYSLVLLDLKLPDIDGTELLRHIKANSSARVLVITGKTIGGYLEEHIADEDRVDIEVIKVADGVIEKPFQIESLLDSIRRLL
jgi:DNA-binding response OmpR family regulator